MIWGSKNNRENYARKSFWTQEPSNNWAQKFIGSFPVGSTRISCQPRVSPIEKSSFSGNMQFTISGRDAPLVLILSQPVAIPFYV